MAAKKKSGSLLFLAVGICLAFAVLFWQAGERGWLPKLKQLAANVFPQTQQQKAAEPAAVVEQKKVEPTLKQPMIDNLTLLNNQGVDLVLKRQYWQGMVFFDKAIKLDAKRIEPVLNMAVTLYEIGLSRPANRYFEMAADIDPANPLLQQNRINWQNKFHNRVEKLSPSNSGTGRKAESPQTALRLWGLNVQYRMNF